MWNCSCFFNFYKPIPSSTFLAVNTTWIYLSFIILVSQSVLPKESHPINYIMSLRMKQSGMTQSQGLGLLLFEKQLRVYASFNYVSPSDTLHERNDCKSFCPCTYLYQRCTTFSRASPIIRLTPMNAWTQFAHLHIWYNLIPDNFFYTELTIHENCV